MVDLDDARKLLPERVEAIEEPTEIALPHTGELISLDDHRQCAGALEEIRVIMGQLKDLKGLLTERIVKEAERQGTKTLHVSDKLTYTLSGGRVIDYDPEILTELLEAGLPEDRFAELITTHVEYKVNKNVIRQLRSNAHYDEIIDRAQTEHETPVRAYPKRRT